MTEKLYYTEPDTLDFTGTVRTAVVAGDRVEIVLDRTAFYPEGGGQPCDLGELAGVAVSHVRKEDGAVVHVLSRSPDPPPSPGETIAGRVDAARRRDFMQQHTGQHIISAALVHVGGYNTVSVHLGDEYSTIEIDASEVPAGDLEAVEDEANRTIEAGLPVASTWVTDSEISGYHLRRPPKVTGSIRLVQVGDVDCVACGGVHVQNTRNVRLVRFVGKESIRGNVRLSWKIGDRALSHYRLAADTVRTIGDLLSAQPHELGGRVKSLDDRVREVESTLRRERETVYRLTAQTLLSSVRDAGTLRVITAEYSEQDAGFLRGVCKELAAVEGAVACLTNRTGDRLHWAMAVGPGVSVNPAEFLDGLLPLISGRGGGKPPVWQGIGDDPTQFARFLTGFRDMAEHGRNERRAGTDGL